MTIPTSEERRQAQEALAYIRDTMESASTFTAVSGWGLVGVGAMGLAAAWLAWATGVPSHLGIWIPTAVVALLVAAVANAAKAKRLSVSIWSASVRKMVWGMAPALVTGGALTFALAIQGANDLLPGTWLALYGAGVTASGTFSVGAIRWMGLALLACGTAALLQVDWGLVALAVGFGGVHLGFGFYIAERHGG